MYSQVVKSNQSSDVQSSFRKMDLITTRRTKRRSILGKGRYSLKLGDGLGNVNGSPGLNGVDKNRVDCVKKESTSDVLQNFPKSNACNPFANKLRESVGSFEDNEEASSGPSSSSEGSARKLIQEDPDITGVFFMDDVESVKKRQLDASSRSHAHGESARNKAAEKVHTVSCNLMTRSPFAKQPLKDQSLRLNRAAEIRALSIRAKGLSSTKKSADIFGSSFSTEKKSRGIAGLQPVLSPVKPVLKSSESQKNIRTAGMLALSAASSLSTLSLHSNSFIDNNTDVLRRSISATDINSMRSETNCINAPRSVKDASSRTASEMHFEQICKLRSEGIHSNNMSDDLQDLFTSKQRRALSNERKQQRSHPEKLSQPRRSDINDNSCRSIANNKAKGRFSVALYSSENVKKSRPSVMSDFIINQNINGLESSNDKSFKQYKEFDLLETTDSKMSNDFKSSSKVVEETEGNDFKRTLVFDDDDDDDSDDTERFVHNESLCNETLVGDRSESARKMKKLSAIEEEEEARARMSINENTSLMDEDTICQNTSTTSEENSLGRIRQIDERVSAVLQSHKHILESHKQFCEKRSEFFEKLRREQNDFVRKQNERIDAFERLEKSFEQEQNSKLLSLFDDISKLTSDLASSSNPPLAASTVEDEVFHTAQKNVSKATVSSPNQLFSTEKDSTVIFSQLKSDFKCLKTPNAHSNRNAHNTTLNQTILTPHSMSVCIQEQVSMLFDA